MAETNRTLSRQPRLPRGGAIPASGQADRTSGPGPAKSDMTPAGCRPTGLNTDGTAAASRRNP